MGKPSAFSFTAAAPELPNAELQALSNSKGPSVVAVWRETRPGARFPLGPRETDWHSHLRGQLFCVVSGLIHVRTRHGSWMLPPNRAGWIPPGEPHSASIAGAMSGWMVFVAPKASHQLPDRPCVISVNALTSQLVQRVAMGTEQRSQQPQHRRIAAVLLDELCRSPQEPLHLPMPRDRRLLRIARAFISEPGDRRTLVQWAEWAGMSSRTLSRLFMADLQVSFAQWCQQARLVHALERLAEGEAVASVSDALGYATPSNFISMFRRSLGQSPRRYVAALRTLEH
ncbi:helix-turn-helix transcriptional regulator [Roseateles sp. SL47]|uniref:AraC family transcriptional regulator n=1 Tax=Roseateles sp. SL47 TaxID=2995138 RepID=UPI0022703D13|nr:helix-turn-helix transcriptional regulator [Roseateles sp. SL47]WAC74247.1 helix-turn-helix transcriptional regulator [Roseateles sp. SL47]